MAKKETSKKKTSKKKTSKTKAVTKKVSKKKTSKKKSIKKTTKSSKQKTLDQPQESDSIEKSSKKTSEKKSKEEPKKIIKEVVEASIEGIDDLQSSFASSTHKMPEKFWQNGAWRVLLDPSMAATQDLAKFDLSELLGEFTKNMLKEDLIDFRVSGMAILSGAKLYHKKIKDVIDEEEKIQIQELRESAKREIPKAMPQPLRESRKIATSDELFSAMRSAIIETMQKRELLRRRRESKIERRQELKVMKSKGQLPKEILKHITGKEKTIEEIMNSWLEKIKAKIKLNDKKGTSFFEITKDLIEVEESDLFAQKLKSIEFFIALLFLSTNGKILIDQMDDFDDIYIELPKYIF